MRAARAERWHGRTDRDYREACCDPQRRPRGPDDIDKALVTALQRNGRESYAALAKIVGLSEAAVRQRVQRLLDDGVVQIVGVTDPMVMGFQRWAMIGIVVEGDVRKVSDQLTAIDEIDYVVLTAGSFDLLIEVVCEDDDRLLALLNDHVRVDPGRPVDRDVRLPQARQADVRVGRALVPSLRIPPDQFVYPDRPYLLQQAEMAGWWARYGKRWAKARWRLRGMQRVGEYPQRRRPAAHRDDRLRGR